MALTIHNVRGDGHCFYRCMWHIARTDVELSSVIRLDEKNNEDVGMQEVRSSVARVIRQDLNSESIVSSLVYFKELHRESLSSIKDTIQCCPILECIDPGLSTRQNCEHVAHAIEHTNIYASSVEIEVMQTVLNEIGVRIVVILWEVFESEDDIAEKWLTQLDKKMMTVRENRICILVNFDNIHYKFIKFRASLLIDSNEFREYITACGCSDVSDDSDEK